MSDEQHDPSELWREFELFNGNLESYHANMRKEDSDGEGEEVIVIEDTEIDDTDDDDAEDTVFEVCRKENPDMHNLERQPISKACANSKSKVEELKARAVVFLPNRALWATYHVRELKFHIDELRQFLPPAAFGRRGGAKGVKYWKEIFIFTGSKEAEDTIKRYSHSPGSLWNWMNWLKLVDKIGWETKAGKGSGRPKRIEYDRPLQQEWSGIFRGFPKHDLPKLSPKPNRSDSVANEPVKRRKFDHEKTVQASFSKPKQADASNSIHRDSLKKQDTTYLKGERNADEQSERKAKHASGSSDVAKVTTAMKVRMSELLMSQRAHERRKQEIQESIDSSKRLFNEAMEKQMEDKRLIDLAIEQDKSEMEALKAEYVAFIKTQ